MKVRHFTTEKIITLAYSSAQNEELVTTFLTEDGDLWQHRYGRWLCINDPKKSSIAGDEFWGRGPETSTITERMMERGRKLKELAKADTTAAESKPVHER